MDPPQLSLADWDWEPTVLLGLAALVVLYVTALRRGWIAGGDDVSPWFPAAGLRSVLFALGVAITFLALCSPIDRGGDEYFFWIHMVQHLLLMMVAPPLLLLGLAGATPPPGTWMRLPRRVWTFLTRPWMALLVFNAVLLVWHIPDLYNTTLRVLPVHIVEHLTFIGAGLVLWWPVVDPVRGPGTHIVTSMSKVALLVLCGLPATVLGLVFSLGSRPFYEFYAQAPRLWGISAVTDQQWAGAVMFGAGNLIFFVAITIIFLRMFGNPEIDEREAEADLGGAVVAARSRTIGSTRSS
ncbi:MAG: cytochrome c oxidase assembly protein [Candidatus Dormibacteria bacterium]